MPTYDVYVKCIDCGGEHSLLMKIFLAVGPERTQSIAEWFQGGSCLHRLQLLNTTHPSVLKPEKSIRLAQTIKSFSCRLGLKKRS